MPSMWSVGQVKTLKPNHSHIHIHLIGVNSRHAQPLLPSPPQGNKVTGPGKATALKHGTEGQEETHSAKEGRPPPIEAISSTWTVHSGHKLGVGRSGNFLFLLPTITIEIVVSLSSSSAFFALFLSKRKQQQCKFIPCLSPALFTPLFHHRGWFLGSLSAGAPFVGWKTIGWKHAKWRVGEGGSRWQHAGGLISSGVVLFHDTWFRSSDARVLSSHVVFSSRLSILFPPSDSTCFPSHLWPDLVLTVAGRTTNDG